MDGAKDFNSGGMPMKDLQGYLTPDQIAILFNACKDDRERLMVRLFWKTGRRVGELLQLQVKDINFQTGFITWHIEKKNIIKRKEGETDISFDRRKQVIKEDYLAVKPIDYKSLKMLVDYANGNKLKPEEYIFGSVWDNERPISRIRVFQIIRRIGEKAGITQVGNKKLHPHHFRHSFAVNISRKAKRPQDIVLLKNALEHSSLNVTMNYLQFSQEDLRDILDEDD